MLDIKKERRAESARRERHPRTHMDTIKHEVSVSGGAGFFLFAESNDTSGFDRTLQ